MSTDFKEIKLFDKTTFEDLIKDIYNRSSKKSKEFEEVLAKLITMAIENPSSAANIMPLLAEYSEISIKNDDSLIKLAGIIQRFESKPQAQAASGDWSLPQDELDGLLDSIRSQKEPILVLNIEESKE